LAFRVLLVVVLCTPAVKACAAFAREGRGDPLLVSLMLMPSAVVNAASVHVKGGHTANDKHGSGKADAGEKPQHDAPPDQKKRRDAAMAGGCFSASTEVETKCGRLRMDELKVGDEILTSQLPDGASPVFKPVTRFLHRNPDVVAEFIVLTTVHNRTLTLTPNHLIPLVDCKTAFGESLDWRFASRATPGQCVVSVDGQHIKIANVERTKAKGIYAPLLSTGYFYADDILVSCYASVESQLLQQSLFKVVSRIWDAVDWLLVSTSAKNVPQLVEYGHAIASVVFEKITF